MMALERIVWIDVLVLALVANFLFDYLLLWATAEVSRIPATRGRLALGALLGTVYFVAYLLAQAGLTPFFRLLRFVPFVLLVSAIMLAVAFPGIPRRRLVTAAGYFYLIGFAAAGAGLSAAFLLGAPGSPHMFAGFLVAVASILTLAELGWGVVQRRLWLHVFQLPVQIRFGDATRELTALVDTGNRLRDPISGHPVMVVEAGALEGLVPAAITELARRSEGVDLDRLSEALAGTPWSARFRLIPYHSIDREHGILIGFRPDELRVRTGNETVATRHAVVGISRRPLDPEGTYQALIHPEIVQSGLGQLPRAVLRHTVRARNGEPAAEGSSRSHASVHPPA